MFYFDSHSDAYKQELSAQFQDNRQAGHVYGTRCAAFFGDLWVFTEGCYLYNVVPSG